MSQGSTKPSDLKSLSQLLGYDVYNISPYLNVLESIAFSMAQPTAQEQQMLDLRKQLKLLTGRLFKRFLCTTKLLELKLFLRVLTLYLTNFNVQRFRVWCKQPLLKTVFKYLDSLYPRQNRYILACIINNLLKWVALDKDFTNTSNLLEKFDAFNLYPVLIFMHIPLSKYKYVHLAFVVIVTSYSLSFPKMS